MTLAAISGQRSWIADGTACETEYLCKINRLGVEATTRIELVYTVLQTVA
jgi:hypothetical protein